MLKIVSSAPVPTPYYWMAVLELLLLYGTFPIRIAFRSLVLFVIQDVGKTRRIQIYKPQEVFNRQYGLLHNLKGLMCIIL